MKNLIIDSVDNAREFEISLDRSRLGIAAELLLNRPDIHWKGGRPDYTVKSPDYASEPILDFSAREVGIISDDGQVNYISFGSSPGEIDLMEGLNESISNLSARLFDGAEVDGHVCFTYGTLMGKIPADISCEDLVFAMCLFRYVYRTLGRVILPIGMDEGFDVDEFETTLLFLLAQKLEVSDVSFDDVAKSIIGNWD